MNQFTEISIELYKRKEYDKIPIGEYANGDLFYMTKKQVKVMHELNDDIVTNIGYGGSARSGKTIIESTAILLDCLSYPDIAWGLGRRELTVLKKTALITLFGQFEFYGLDQSDYNYNQQQNRITLFNKSEIFLIDTKFLPSDPLNTRFGGLELTRAAVDESNETELSVIQKIFERTGWRNNEKYGLKRKLLETFNPSKNHVYKRFYLPFRDKNEQQHSKFTPALPGDNPHPSVQEWIDDMMKDADQVTIERQIHGNFDYDDDPSSLCTFDAIQDIFTNDHVLTGGKRISADLAMQGRDKFIALLQDGGVVQILIEKGKAKAREIELDLKGQKIHHQIGNTSIVADSDGLGEYLESYIKNIKAFHGGSTKLKHEYKQKYKNIKAACAYLLASKINKREIHIKCTPNQEEYIKNEITICLKRGNVDKDGKLELVSKKEMKSKLGHSPDYLDALIMLQYWDVIPSANVQII